VALARVAMKRIRRNVEKKEGWNIEVTDHVSKHEMAYFYETFKLDFGQEGDPLSSSTCSIVLPGIYFNDTSTDVLGAEWKAFHRV